MWVFRYFSAVFCRFVWLMLFKNDYLSWLSFQFAAKLCQVSYFILPLNFVHGISELYRTLRINRRVINYDIASRRDGVKNIPWFISSYPASLIDRKFWLEIFGPMNFWIFWSYLLSKPDLIFCVMKVKFQSKLT